MVGDFLRVFCCVFFGWLWGVERVGGGGGGGL